MNSAKRRINSTGRKKIPQDKIDLRILPAVSGESLRAKLDIDLSSLNLSPSAAISVEAYQRSTAMRFDCGTVAAKNIPDTLVLNELDQSASVLFRIKIVDREEDVGKILASADRVRPLVEGEKSDRRSIFPVQYSDLGQEIWGVDIDDDAGPLLLLNSRIPTLMHLISNDHLLAGSVLPAAFRIVLSHLASDPAVDDEGGSWKSDWLRFCKENLGIEDEPDDLEDDDAREVWVSQVVRRYCETRAFVDQVKNADIGARHG